MSMKVLQILAHFTPSPIICCSAVLLCLCWHASL